MTRLVRFSVSALLAATIAAQTPALRKGVSVQMPVTRNAVVMPDADTADSLVVAVTFRGTVFLEVTTVTPAQLSEKVKAYLAGRPGKRVYLKGDARAPYSTVVVEVLDTLRTAGVNAPVLLTSEPDSTNASYVPPMGLEVLLTPAPNGAQLVTLKAGGGQASDAELKQRARRDRAVVLTADGTALFGDVVHAVDVSRAAGAKVFLSTAK